ncbi:MAG: glycosyltransferase [Planctomycetota bacterium]
MNDKLPRITVIVPHLEQPRYLERALCSVIDQGYDNLELIVMDGGSGDESLELLRAYDEHIDHWQSDWDSGPAEAVNTALNWATGDLVGVLDGDDAYLPFALHEVAKVLGVEVGDGPDWAVGSAVRVDECDEPLGEHPADPPRSLASFLMHDAGPLPGSAVFYRTELLKIMGGFDSTFRLAYAHEMHARLYTAEQRPGVIKPAVAAVRDHDASLTAAHALGCGDEFVVAAERYGNQLPPTPRYLLWRKCDEARRLYAAAEAEIAADPDRRVMWSQLLRRPWWLARDGYRRQLLRSLGQAPTAMPAPADADRRAA